MYNPKYEDDFLNHIPAKYKQVYLQFLLRNIGLFAESEKNESRQKFLYFLMSAEGLDIAKKNGAIILYNDETLKGA